MEDSEVAAAARGGEESGFTELVESVRPARDIVTHGGRVLHG
ncbi:MAG: hypothetical protein ACRDWI_09355 [Jiangellaceae bacterium]